MFDDQKEYLSFLQITSDLLCLIVLYWLVIPFLLKLIRWFSLSSFASDFAGNNFYMKIAYIKIFPAFILLPFLFMFLFRGYRKTGRYNTLKILYHAAIISISAGIVLFFAFYDTLTCSLDKIYPLMVWSFFLMFGVFILNRIHIRYIIEKGSNNNIVKHILLAGTGNNAISIARFIVKHPECGLRVTGFLTGKKHEVGKVIFNKRIFGEMKDLVHVTQNHYTDCILFTGDDGCSQYYDFLIKTCSIMGIDFAVVDLGSRRFRLDPQQCQILHKRISTESIENFKIKLVKFVYRSPRLSFLKRVFDFTISSVLICLCIPFWIVIPIAIKLTSSGPVLFRQVRVGQYGKKFVLYKFRSMINNAEVFQTKLMHLNEMDGPAFKIKNDPRQTITGRVLRKTSLDELPQLFNVFKGDISMVGPRPAIVREVQQYYLWERKRLSVIQGITCFWQVSGRNTIKFDEWMKLDLMYIDTWDFALDLRIFFKTIPAVLLKKGAY